MKKFFRNVALYGAGATLAVSASSAFAVDDPDITGLTTAASGALASAKTAAGTTGGQVIAAVVVVAIVGILIALMRKA